MTKKTPTLMAACAIAIALVPSATAIPPDLCQFLTPVIRMPLDATDTPKPDPTVGPPPELTVTGGGQSVTATTCTKMKEIGTCYYHPFQCTAEARDALDTYGYHEDDIGVVAYNPGTLAVTVPTAEAMTLEEFWADARFD